MPRPARATRTGWHTQRSNFAVIGDLSFLWCESRQGDGCRKGKGKGCTGQHNCDGKRWTFMTHELVFDLAGSLSSVYRTHSRLRRLIDSLPLWTKRWGVSGVAVAGWSGIQRGFCFRRQSMTLTHHVTYAAVGQGHASATVIDLSQSSVSHMHASGTWMAV